MALRFFDGFDHYAAGSLLTKWTAWSSAISFSTGRFGGNSLWVSNRDVTKVLDAQTEWIVGFAVNWDGDTPTLVGILNGGTVQVDMRCIGSTGVLEVRRAGTTVLGSSTDVLSVGTWHYVELRVLLSDTVGEVQLWIDGVEQFNLTSQDTINSGATADRIRLMNGALTANPKYDDLYICDGTGSAPYDGALGDVRVEALFPDGNGNSSLFVGSDADATDNYLLVDDATPSEADYVESSTVGDKDTYTFDDLSTLVGTVYAVQILPWARKTDAGSREIVSVARLSATEEDSAGIVLTSTGTYVTGAATGHIRTTKPGGGTWSIDDVNNAEFGVKVST